MSGWWKRAAMAALLAGCGGADAPPGEPPSACGPGELVVAAGCQPAGVPADLPCPPGDVPLAGGGCRGAGVAEDGCGDGFAYDGDGGCEPLLPDMPCGAGTMAIPGETSCRPVADCGAAPWGNIPVDASTQYVDASYTGGNSDGSAAAPWTSVQAAVSAAAANAIVAVAAGSYAEDVTLTNKAVRLWGRCPSMVEIVGTGGVLAAVRVLAGASQSEVHQLAVTGPTMGLAVSGSEQVLVEQIWAHDTGWRGVDAEDDLGPTSLTLRGSLIENAVELGAASIGSSLAIEDSVIRDVAVSSTGVVGGGLRGELSPLGRPAGMTLSHSLIERVHHAAVFVWGGGVEVDSCVLRDVAPDGNGFARGVGGEANEGVVSNVEVKRSLIERSQEIGLAALGSLLVVESSVVREVSIQLAVDGTGRGISVQALPPLRGGLVLHDSLVAGNHDAAVFVAGADAEIVGTRVRDTTQGAVFAGGRGLTIQSHSMSGEPSVVTVADSRFDRNVEGGIVAVGSSLDVRGVAVRDTLASADLGLGRGIVVQADEWGAPSHGHVESSLVERATETGVFVSSSELELRTSSVLDTQLGASDFARGLHIQPNAPGGTPIVHVWGSRIATSRQSSVVVTSADATIERSLIEDTRASANPDRPFGDAITAVAETGPVILRVSDSKVLDSHRAALASFGATVHLVGSRLSCQAFDLSVEEYYGSAVDLHDDGDNLCGCPEATEACLAISSGLAAPEALAPENPQ